jgi:hypothetical protein
VLSRRLTWVGDSLINHVILDYLVTNKIIKLLSRSLVRIILIFLSLF